MDVRLLYLEGCPNLALARQRLGEALRRLGSGTAVVKLELVASPADAERLGFRGSPTILFNGHDPFATEDTPTAFSCRMYRTDAGPEGSPSVRQLEEALRR